MADKITFEQCEHKHKHKHKHNHNHTTTSSCDDSDSSSSSQIPLVQKIKNVFQNSSQNCWEKRIHLLIEYKKEHEQYQHQQNQYDKRFDDIDDPNMPPELAIWICELRLADGSQLNTNELQSLQKIDFDWKTNIVRKKDITFDWNFSKLRLFKTMFGHLHVPIRWKHDPAFGKWVSRQRDEARCLLSSSSSSSSSQRKRLCPRRKKRLDDIGFVWYIAPEDRKYTQCQKHEHNQWYKKYENVKAFYRLHGHCNIQSGLLEDDSLQVWISLQLERAAQGDLSNDKVMLLREIGIITDRTPV